MSFPDVSIVMPVFNAGETIEEAIKSCLNQTKSSFELVVVLDGCTDASAEIVHSFEDSRIRVLEREHKGVTQAASEAIRFSVAPLIARMDADDISHPSRLDLQEEFLTRYPHFSAVSGQVRLLDQSAKECSATSIGRTA